jgi:excisionase family DNA binding protein
VVTGSLTTSGGLADELVAALAQCPAVRDILARLTVIEDVLRDREKPYYSVDEVAARFGRTSYTVRRWIAGGRLRATRLQEGGPRGRLLVPRDEVRRVEATGGTPAGVADEAVEK